MHKITDVLRAWAGAAGIIVAAGVLRIYQIFRYDFWFDESVTVSYTYPYYQFYSRIVDASAHLTRTSLGHGFPYYFCKSVWQDLHPPLYYGLASVFSFFFPDPFSLRVLSAVFGVGSLVVLYAIARRFLRWPYALLALGIMAASPFHVWYAQEARDFTLCCFLFLWAVYCFIRARADEGRKWWFLFFFSVLIAFSATYYAVIALILPLLYLYEKRSSLPIARLAIGVVVVLLVTIGVMAVLPLKQMRHVVGGVFWLYAPSLRIFIFSPLVFLGGYLASFWQMAAGLLLAWPLVFAGLWAFYRNDKAQFSLLFSLTLLPGTLLFLISRTGVPLYLDRNLIILSPFYYIVMAKGASSIGGKWLRKAIVVLLALFLSMSLVTYYRGQICCSSGRTGDFYPGVHPRKHYRPAMQRMLTAVRPGDKIVTADKQSFFLLLNGVRRYPPAAVDALTFAFCADAISPFEKHWLIHKIRFWKVCRMADYCAWSFRRQEVSRIAPEGLPCDRFWFVASSWDRTKALSAHSNLMREFLSKGYRQSDAFDQDGFFVWLYER